MLERRAVSETLREGRPAGAVAAVALAAGLMLADLLEGSKTQYVGLLVGPPLLAASFVPPLTTVLVGIASLSFGAAYGAYEGAGTDSPQVLRLIFIALATAIAALVSALREAREDQLADLETIAEVAQQTVLRPLPPVVGDLSIAVRYVSATSAARVGGDFYEVIETDRGVRLLIGDVRGKGLDAVRLASVVLGSFRQAAHTETDERDLLRALDAAVGRVVDEEEFVTAIVAGVQGATLRLASAGHPPPLLVGQDGVRELVSPPALPLGLGTDPDPVEVRVAPDELVLFYTDGLEEARDGDRWFDVHGEVARAFRSDADLEGGLDRLQRAVERFLGGAPTDDVALLAVRLRSDRPAPAGEPSALAVPAFTGAGGAASGC